MVTKRYFARYLISACKLEVIITLFKIILVVKDSKLVTDL